ncbi:MAG: hypothetical protein LBU81_03145 [Methanosarcinales archaeon]|jgi:ATP-dependent protease HslVU (ClpYQ) peptidase subunit|nr:hypothetical protein [Methanosarcinales archaeon]
MTLIIAIKDEDYSWVICDSRVIAGEHNIGEFSKNQKKAFTVKGNKIIGVAGSVRDHNLIYSNKKLFKKDLNFKNLVNDIVPSIFSLFSKNGRVSKSQEGFDEIDSEILIATDSGIWAIYQNGLVREADFISIGCAGDYAEACYLMLKSMDFELDTDCMITRIESSLCKIDGAVGYPLHLFNTKNGFVRSFSNEEEVKEYLYSPCPACMSECGDSE